MNEVPHASQSNRLSAFHRFARSGRLTPLLVGLLCAALLIASAERGRGNLHRIQDAVGTAAPPPIPQPTGPGGQDPIRLSRSATAVGSQPEFLSATFFPGRGMQLFQLTASIPGHGEVPLLFSPTLSEATQMLSGAGDDANGSASTTFGAAFLAPWAGQLSGTTSTPGTLQAIWNDQRLTFPASAEGSSQSVEGLLLNHPADAVKTTVTANGQTALATFHSPASSGWPSSYDVAILIELSGQALELTVTTRNTGTHSMPIGIGWHPYFAIPSGDRADAVLTLPSSTIAETTLRSGMPTGKSTSTYQTPQDFMRSSGTRLGATSLNATFLNLQSGVLADGPVAELRDPSYNLALRLVPLSSNINSLHVVAPADKPWVSISPNTNLDDPFGAQWGSPQNAGITTLAPGATFQWKVRLELALSNSALSQP